MQLLRFAIRHSRRLVWKAIGAFNPQNDKISRKIMRQWCRGPYPSFAVTRHYPRVILGDMPVGDDETVGNHRSGRDHVRRFDADDPVGPPAYRFSCVACRRGQRKLEQAQGRKREEMSFQASHGLHPVLRCLQRQGHKPPRLNAQAIRRDIGLSSIWPASIWASCNVSSALIPA